MAVSSVNMYSSLTTGASALSSARQNSEEAKFSDLIKKIKNNDNGTLSSSEVAESGRLNGEYSTGFSGIYTSESDKKSMPRGAAINQSNPNVKPKLIDRTSELYEKALELENYFVKQMLSEMRKTIQKANESDFAMSTYEDMLWDEYSAALTKNAGFGLADQIYTQLSISA